MKATARIPSVLLALGLGGAIPSLSSQAPTVRPAPVKPANNYWVYVGAESADLIHRVRFGPDGAVVEKTIPVGQEPTEMEGPHGLQVSADGRFLHMTTGHGSPDGKYWKYALGPDTLVGPPISLGYFPASIDVSADGQYAFAVNFNLHGEMVPSTVSVIYTPTNTEITQVPTCTMPHGSRIDATGMRQYSTCMMDDQLVEISTASYEVTRRFSVAKGAEAGLGRDDLGPHAGQHRGMKMAAASCSPTWAQPDAIGEKIYVACNKADHILEIDRATWSVSRRFQTGRGPYNLAVTPDNRLLVVSLKPGASVQVIELATGAVVYTERSSTTVTHGVALSPDSKYAFVSSEGVGAAPGKVDIYDLTAFARVGSVEVGQQAGGIAFWRMERAQ